MGFFTSLKITHSIFHSINQSKKVKNMEKMDKLDQLISRFNYWNNRGKSAICRYILEQLDITEEQFLDHLHGWKERKLVLDEKGFFEVKIEHQIKI